MSRPLTIRTGIQPSWFIIAYYGRIADLSAGWFPCDGEGGRPDLRGRYLRHHTDDSEIKTTGGATSTFSGSHQHGSNGQDYNEILPFYTDNSDEAAHDHFFRTITSQASWGACTRGTYRPEIPEPGTLEAMNAWHTHSCSSSNFNIKPSEVSLDTNIGWDGNDWDSSGRHVAWINAIVRMSDPMLVLSEPAYCVCHYICSLTINLSALDYFGLNNAYVSWTGNAVNVIWPYVDWEATGQYLYCTLSDTNNPDESENCDGILMSNAMHQHECQVTVGGGEHLHSGNSGEVLYQLEPAHLGSMNAKYPTFRGDVAQVNHTHIGTTSSILSGDGAHSHNVHMRLSYPQGMNETVEPPYYTARLLYSNAGGDGLGNEIPVGGIIAMSSSTGTIPSGYAFCDGTNGTPDLRHRYIRGTSDNAMLFLGNTGGVNTMSIPSHTHETTFSDTGHIIENHNRGGWHFHSNTPYDGYYGNNENNPYTSGDSSGGSWAEETKIKIYGEGSGYTPGDDFWVSNNSSHSHTFSAATNGGQHLHPTIVSDVGGVIPGDILDLRPNTIVTIFVMRLY